MNDKFKRQIWISFGIIFSSIAAAAAGLYFLSANLNADSVAIVRNRSLLATQTNFLASLANLKQDAPTAAQYQAVMSKLVPSQYQLINFSAWLTEQAKTRSVSVTFAFQGSPTAPQGSTPGTAPFALSVSGAINDDIAFLQYIESQAPAFLLSLSSFDVSNDGTTAQVMAQGVLYFQ